MASGEWENHKYVNKKWVNGRWVYDYGSGYVTANKIKNTANDVKKYGVNGVKSYATRKASELRGAAGHVYYDGPRQFKRQVVDQAANRVGSAVGAAKRKVRRFTKNAQGRLKLVKKKLDSLTAESRERVLKAYKKIKNKTRGFRNAVRKGYMKATLPARATVKKAYNDATRSLRTGTAQSRVKSEARRVSGGVKRASMKQQHIKSMSPRRRELYEKHLEKKKNKNKGG